MRRKGLIVLVSAVVVLFLSRAGVDAQPRGLDADTIKAGLKTATPEENGFVDRVVRLVDQGRLPAGMVRSTFIWARQKPRRKFQYFRRAMIVRAARIGVRL